MLDMNEGMKMEKPVPTVENPNVNLRGENLEYYKNIQYLKEMTRQANALLDRSNAKYENILDDQKLGYRVRARSISDSSKSASPELEGKCKKCGLAHGATTFCIVEQIMFNEKEIEDNKRRSKLSKGAWSFKSFVSTDLKKLLLNSESGAEETQVKQEEHSDLENVNLLDKMTPSQLLDYYDALCFRYGPNSGRKFLLANALKNPPDRNIEKWTTTPESHPPKRPDLEEKPQIHYPDMRAECESVQTQPDNLLCPDMSRDVVQKMEQVVQVLPSCQTQPLDCEKNWKKVFKNVPPKRAESPEEDDVWSHEHVTFESSKFDEPCKCKVQTCVCQTSKICTSTQFEKKCKALAHEEDYDNNYLLKMRKRIWGRREAKRKETQMLQKDNLKDVAVARSKSEEYLAGCRFEQYKTLKGCLTKKVTGYDEQEFDNYVRMVGDRTATIHPINPRQLDRWNEQLIEQEKIEEMDEIDSLPSEIQSDEESSLFSHPTGADCKYGRINPSRIPHAEDVYDLIDNLYEKITRKFETGIRKNSFKTSRLSYRPTYAFLHSKINLLTYCNPLFKEIMYRAKFVQFTKRLTPFRIRKMRKLKRLNAMERRLKHTERRRNMTRGLQLGKRYRRMSKSEEYDPISGYSGFRPQERQLLSMKTPNRFGTFNLAGDFGRGKALTVRRIHHDFRLIRRMFEDAAQSERNDLIDEGMQKRLREFQERMCSRKLPEPPITETDTEEEKDSSYTYRKFMKEEMQLLQKANISNLNQTHVNVTKSNECIPLHEKSRPKTYGKCRTSNSEDKLKNVVPGRRNTKQRGQKPQKLISDTDVKEKRRNSLGIITQPKVGSRSIQDHGSRSVRPLTNLLPPLSSHNHESPRPKAQLVSFVDDEINNEPSDCGKMPIIQLKEKVAPTTRRSALTRLPKLETPVKTCTKTNDKKIRDESLPSIKQRESVENLKPTPFQAKPARRALARKMSVLDVNVDRSAMQVDRKLPTLVDKTKLGNNPCEEPFPKTRRKPIVRSRQILTGSKQSGFEAWR